MDVTPNPGARVFRRKRRFQGATWTPPTMSASFEDGVWCPFHRQRHGYMSKQLGLSYDKSSTGHWVMLWYCKETGNVLKEKELSNE